jgi:multicomponent Na+:H+ antiporter subunit B
MVSDLPEYGKIKVSSESYVTKYYIANSKTEMGITNVVTSVLAGYRSFDTLGEVVVIFIAGISVLGILRKRSNL